MAQSMPVLQPGETFAVMAESGRVTLYDVDATGVVKTKTPPTPGTVDPSRTVEIIGATAADLTVEGPPPGPRTLDEGDGITTDGHYLDVVDQAGATFVRLYSRSRDVIADVARLTGRKVRVTFEVHE